MEINKTITSLVIIALLTSAGLVSQVAQGDVYYCGEKELVMQCARFSDSGLRCYPSLTDTKGYKDCSNWEKVVDEINMSDTIITDLDSDYICIKNRVSIVSCDKVEDKQNIKVIKFVELEN